MRHRLWTAGLAVLASLVVATAAQAAPSLTSVSAAPADPTAGAHSNFTVAFSLSGLGDVAAGDDLRSLSIELPPGLVGDPNAPGATCSSAQLHADACPAATRVGTTTVTADVTLGLVPLTGQSIPGDIYDVAVAGTEAARLGIVLRPNLVGLPAALPKVILESPVRVRTATDAGLTSTVDDIPATEPTLAGTAQLKITAMSLTLEAAANGNAFMTNPTSCAEATTRITAGTYAGGSATGSAAFTPTGCDSVPFTPAFALGADPAGADVPTALSATVSLPYSRTVGARAQSQPRRAVVTLPEGFELSPTVGSAGGLTGCTDAQFGRGSSAPSSCPTDSLIGTVSFASPLVSGPLSGQVFLAADGAGALTRVLIVAEQGPQADALRIKLVGAVSPDERTGQVTTTLDDLPPLPFTAFTLSFRGGEHAVFSSPRSCGAATGSAALAPFSGGQTVTPSGSVTIAGDCPDPAAFSPTLSVTADPSQAGATTTLTTLVERPDRQARIGALKVSLPPGLLGRLPQAASCALAQARAGDCPEDSRVGTVTATSGPGSAPLSIDGPVYLTEGFDGSLAGLSIVVPAKVGPLDLGRAVTMAKLSLRPDSGLDVVADSVPTRLHGIALAVRSLRLTLDRPGFALNPTVCTPLTASASFTSDLGATAGTTAPYQATGCDGLPFAPRLEASIGKTAADVRKAAHPAVTVTVTQQPGEANAKSVAVTLPRGLSANIASLSKSCALATYQAGGCPASSVVGTATAVTPLLAAPLSGKVTVVTAPGVPLPQLRVALRGAISLDLIGNVSFGAGNRIVNTFDGIPDVPLSRFTLAIDAGPNSPLSVGGDLCTSGMATLDGAFAAHAGKTATAKITAKVPGCTAAAARRPSVKVRVGSLRAGRPALRVTADGRGARLSKVSIRLPKGLSVSASRIKRLAAAKLTGAKGKAKVSVVKGRLVLTLPKGGAQRARLLLRSGALRPGASLRRASKPRLTFRADVTVAGRSRSQAVTVRVRPVKHV
ncbi:MAG: hypothetical protein QOH43_4355 [Solirubrobacteraceae bacterium]|nr:hypothetical protein [Solirubrobacteraceae bacterium]